MKIIKFTKTRNSMYKLTLDDKRTVNVHEELILKNGYLLSKEIDEETIENIDKLNNNLSAYDIAIKYLSNRLRSIKEVREYLKKKEIDKEIIDEIINKLKSQKYLDDKIYAKAFINDQINFSNNGPYKIRKELENNGVYSNIVDECMEIYTSDLEREKLEKLVPKYINTIRNKSYTMMKNKVLNHFNDLGYNKAIVQGILEDVSYDDSDSYKKEYDKLYRKYSKTLSGEELEFKINQSLYKKGFRK